LVRRAVSKCALWVFDKAAGFIRAIQVLTPENLSLKFLKAVLRPPKRTGARETAALEITKIKVPTYHIKVCLRHLRQRAARHIAPLLHPHNAAFLVAT
jgi:hypothetical protein